MTVRKLCARALVTGLFAFAPSFLAGQDVAALYKAKCQSCHAADGSGNTPAGKKTGARAFSSPEVKKMTDDDLTAAIAAGKGKMPGYGKSLKEEQVKALVVYVKELGNKK